VTLDLVPFRGHTVPVLNGKSEISRYSMQQYLNDRTFSFNGMTYHPGNSYGIVTTYNNKPAEPISYNFAGFVEGMLYADGPVAAAEGYRLRVFGQAPLLYQELVDGRPGDLFDDDALERLREPWPSGNLGDLMKRALIYGDFAGNAFVLDIDDELVLVRPDWVEILLAKREFRGGQVGWRQMGIVYYEGGLHVGDGVPFLPGEYCHFVPGLPDPLAAYRGMSWLTPLIREVQSDKSAMDHKVAFFSNAATPNLAVSLPKEITPEQFRKFVDEMDEKHKGPLQAGKTLYTAGGADVTVIGANMKEMDFSSVMGKSETRIANAAGVPPVLLSFSEGMQGSSLNAGNYTAAKRNFVDTTMRDLWQNWAGSLQKMDAFRPPKAKARLWYDGRDIPFLHEDAKDRAEIQQIEASTLSSHISAGWKPDSAVLALLNDDLKVLEHTGLTSVQLVPPGTSDEDGDGVDDAEGEYDALLDEFRAELGDWDIDRARWNLRHDAGTVGGGQFRKLSDAIVALLRDWDGVGDPFRDSRCRKPPSCCGGSSGPPASRPAARTGQRRRTRRSRARSARHRCGRTPPSARSPRSGRSA
jgi:phage portal protein BeeE